MSFGLSSRVARAIWLLAMAALVYFLYPVLTEGAVEGGGGAGMYISVVQELASHQTAPNYERAESTYQAMLPQARAALALFPFSPGSATVPARLGRAPP